MGFFYVSFNDYREAFNHRISNASGLKQKSLYLNLLADIPDYELSDYKDLLRAIQAFIKGESIDFFEVAYLKKCAHLEYNAAVVALMGIVCSEEKQGLDVLINYCLLDQNRMNLLLRLSEYAIKENIASPIVHHNLAIEYINGNFLKRDFSKAISLIKEALAIINNKNPSPIKSVEPLGQLLYLYQIDKKLKEESFAWLKSLINPQSASGDQALELLCKQESFFNLVLDIGQLIYWYVDKSLWVNSVFFKFINRYLTFYQSSVPTVQKTIVFEDLNEIAQSLPSIQVIPRKLKDWTYNDKNAESQIYQSENRGDIEYYLDLLSRAMLGYNANAWIEIGNGFMRMGREREASCYYLLGMGVGAQWDLLASYLMQNYQKVLRTSQWFANIRKLFFKYKYCDFSEDFNSELKGNGQGNESVSKYPKKESKVPDINNHGNSPWQTLETTQSLKLRRKVCLDTETTGLSAGYDRICEIAAIEFDANYKIVRTLHYYVNPQRNVPYSAYKVHGLNNDFLSDKPTFPMIAKEVSEFLSGADIYIHNASFDTKFLNFELKNSGFTSLDYLNANVICTLKIARKLFPRRSNTLDALCDRLSIDRTIRSSNHGALIDTKLLLEVIKKIEVFKC